MEPTGASNTLIPFEDFLTSGEPVWVWDSSERRVAWANAAGLALWGARDLEALKARRFKARHQAVRRMAALAAAPLGEGQWVERLVLPEAGHAAPLICAIQSLELAGGRQGLIVKPLAVRPLAPRAGLRRVADGGDHHQALAAIAEGVQASAARQGAASPAAGPDVQALLAEACHELRNPLNVIVGLAEFMKDGTAGRLAPERLRGYAEDIHQSALLAMALIEDLAARAQPAAGASRRPVEPVDSRSLVEASLRMVAPAARKAGITLRRYLASAAPPLIADPRNLQQILLNLLMNALKYTPRGGTVRVSARRGKDGTLTLGVKDTGKGMSKKEIARVLGPRAKPRRGGKRPGSGIGLPLVKTLVETNGGALHIESRPRQGTQVRLIFPASRLVCS